MQGSRLEQQDVAVWFEVADWRLGILADGMGGHRDGRWVAHAAVSAAHGFLESEEGELWLTQEATPERAILRAFSLAHQAALRSPPCSPGDERRNPATTLIIVALKSNELWWGTAGDSLLLIARRGKVIKSIRTTNESAVGFDPEGLSEMLLGHEPVELECGDSVLLASDGLDTIAHKVVQPSGGVTEWTYDLPASLLDTEGDAVKSTTNLLDAVKQVQKPHQDNVTVLVLIA